jgi:hypothetical protein
MAETAGLRLFLTLRAAFREALGAEVADGVVEVALREAEAEERAQAKKQAGVAGDMGTDDDSNEEQEEGSTPPRRQRRSRGRRRWFAEGSGGCKRRRRGGCGG